MIIYIIISVELSECFVCKTKSSNLKKVLQFTFQLLKGSAARVCQSWNNDVFSVFTYGIYTKNDKQKKMVSAQLVVTVEKLRHFICLHAKHLICKVRSN